MGMQLPDSDGYKEQQKPLYECNDEVRAFHLFVKTAHGALKSRGITSLTPWEEQYLIGIASKPGKSPVDAALTIKRWRDLTAKRESKS